MAPGDRVVWLTTLNSAAIAERPRPSRLRRGAAALLFVLAAAVSVVVYFRTRDPAAEHVQAGRNALLMNNGPAAEREWKEAVRLNPNSAPAWELLAEYYTRDENDEAAIEPLRRLARLRPETPHIFDRLASCVCRLGDPRSNLREAETALQRDPDDAAEIAIAAKALSSLDDEQRRLGYVRRFVKLRPNDMDGLILAARTLTTAHLYDEA